jgi:succinoglycan biosynthesis protein ExoM
MSLINQTAPKTTTYFITVIDNDKTQSAKPVVDNFKTLSKVPIHYVCEENRGIPFARNRALDESLKLGADYIAFVDDDEQAFCDWLSTLYTYLCSYSDCVVIHGRVIPKFPEDTPQQMREIFYTKKERLTGARLQACATNNVIFSTDILRKFNLYFDSSAPFAGGTDTKFFFEVNQRGVPIYECAEAVVYEAVFPSRLKMSWIMHRKYRSGVTTAWIRLRIGVPKLDLVLNSIGSTFLHLTLSVFFAIFFQRTLRNKQLLKTARSLGVLTGIFSIKVNSYANVDL